jgi:hypothetical protein
LWLQQRLGLSLSLVAGIMLGSQIGEVANPEATAVKTRLRSQAASETKSDSAATHHPPTAQVCVMPPGRALLDAGQVNEPKRIKLGLNGATPTALNYLLSRPHFAYYLLDKAKGLRL